MTNPTACAAKPHTHKIITAFFVAFFFAIALTAAPATAHAVEKKWVAEPRTAVSGMSIWTKSTYSDWKNIKEESKTNLTRDDKTHFYYMEKGKHTASLKLRFENAAIADGGQSVDYVVTFNWVRQGNTNLSEKARVYHYGSHQIKFASSDVDGNKIDPWRGSTVTQTIHAYKSGTTTPVSGKFQLYYDDIDSKGPNGTRNPDTDTYVESIELVENYNDTIYLGEAISKAKGHTNDIDGSRLHVGTRNDNPYIYASHDCEALADSSISFLAEDGYTCKMYGWGNQGMHLGFIVNGDGDTDRRPKATVRFHANGGTVGDTSNYKLSNGIIQKKNGSSWETVTDSLKVTAGYKDLKDVWDKSYAKLSKTGYHVVDDKTYDPDDNKTDFASNSGTKLNSTNRYYISNNSASYYYFNPNNTASTDANKVTTKRLNNGTQITSDKTFTLYVKWMPNEYHVNFNGNGNTGGSTLTPEPFFYSQTKALNANGFTKTGYRFLKWNSQANGTGTDYTDKSDQINLTSTRDATVQMYAQWTPKTYGIVYAGMEGATFVNSTQAPWPTKISYDSTFTVSQAKKPGYHFLGWEISKMTSGDVHQYGPTAGLGNTTTATTLDLKNATYANNPGYYKNLRCEDSNNANECVVFTAKWEPITYNIEYILNGGYFADGTSHPNSAQYDQWFTVDNPLRHWYDFKGWKISNMTSGDTHLYGSSTTSYSATTQTTLSNIYDRVYRNLRISETPEPNTVYYEADWEPKFTVELYVDDFEEPWQTLIAEVDEGETWSVPDGYTEGARKWECHHPDGTQGLVAWYWDEELEREFTPQALEKGTTKLYAKNYATVTYAHGAGSDIAEEYMLKDPDTGKFKKAGTIDELAELTDPFEVPYGTVAGLSSRLDKLRLYYENPTIPDALPLTNRAEEGWHSTYDCDAEDSFSRVKVTEDTTVYKLWQTSTYDRITTYLI